ncbi:MAG: GNAT family N-acetyltransferase [Candidatus Hodarchaeota archaeon]
MDKIEIKLVASESESKALDELLWEVLWRPVGLPHTIRRSFKIEGESVELVAIVNSKVVGGLVANWRSPVEVELRHLAVKPEVQGKTMGSKLVEKLISIVSQRNCSTVQTISRNTSAGFFRKLGFVPQPGKAPEHPVFKKHGITFEIFEFKCKHIESVNTADKKNSFAACQSADSRDSQQITEELKGGAPL